MKRQFFISILAFIALSIIQPLAYALELVSVSFEGVQGERD